MILTTSAGTHKKKRKAINVDIHKPDRVYYLINIKDETKPLVAPCDLSIKAPIFSSPPSISIYTIKERRNCKIPVT
jgi:hypothetical protein